MSQNTENIRKILVDRLNDLFAFYDPELDEARENIKIDKNIKINNGTKGS